MEEIFYESGDLNTRLFIEDVELDQMMQYPKNSLHILQLFSQIAAPILKASACSDVRVSAKHVFEQYVFIDVVFLQVYAFIGSLF